MKREGTVSAHVRIARTVARDTRGGMAKPEMCSKEKDTSHSGRILDFIGVRRVVAMLIVAAALSVGCSSARLESPKAGSVTVRGSCRLMPVLGDAKVGVTSGGDVLLVAHGKGVWRSEDLGMTFDQTADPARFRWPSLAIDDSEVWVSWVTDGAVATAVVAPLGNDLGLPIPVMESSRNLIDTELVALGGAQLLLFVTEVAGAVNDGSGTYVVHCLHSGNGGLTWAQRSTVVTGPTGENLEDTRAIVLPGGHILLAYERETAEGGASEIELVWSDDDGVTWSGPTLLWGGRVADREPGGFARVGREIWFVASTDESSPGSSYTGARIFLIKSRDGGRTWSPPTVLIDEPDQLAMGAVVVDTEVVVASVRKFKNPQKRFLSLYRVDPIGRWRVPCGSRQREPNRPQDQRAH